MKKIAFISPFMTHYRKYFYTSLNNAMNDSVTFFFQNKTKDDGRPGIKIKQDNDLFRTYKNKFINISSIKISFSNDLINKIRKSNIRVIVIEGSTSNLTSWILLLLKNTLKIKIVIWACGWQPEQNSIFISKIKVIAEKMFFGRADKIINYSSKSKNYYQKIGIKTPTTIAYNGIDIDIYNKKATKITNEGAELTFGIKKKIFLYVGGIFKDKNVELLINTFSKFNAENPDSLLWIIGDGPMKSELEKYVQYSSLKNIKFWGRIENEVDKFFCAADFFVLPGVGGLALNQAMLWGTPCIVSEADGTEDDLVIEGLTGFRFIKNDAISLKNKMEIAAGLTKEEYEKMSKKSHRLIIERSNTDEMVKTFKHEISSLL